MSDIERPSADRNLTTEDPGARARLVKRIALLGPAFVIGAVQFGAGSTVSAASAGGNIGYSIIWLIVLSTILMLVYVDMGVRIGLSSEASPVGTITATLGRFVGVLAGAGMAVISTLFNVGNVLGASIGLQLLTGRGSILFWAVVVTVAALLVLWTRRAYPILEKIALLLIGTMVASFVITAVISGPEWSRVALGFVPRALPDDMVLALALVGTNFSMFGAFYIMYTIREKGTRREQYRDTTLTDTLPGVIAPGIMVILIIVAGASVLNGRSVESATDLAGILQPVLGSGAVIVFAVGLFAAGFSSIIVGTSAAGSILGDAVGWGYKLRERKVRLIAVASLLTAFGLGAAFRGLPVQLILTVNALVVLVFPLVATVILLLANKTSLVGTLRNSRWQNIIGIVGWTFAVLAAVRVAYELISGAT